MGILPNPHGQGGTRNQSFGVIPARRASLGSLYVVRDTIVRAAHSPARLVRLPFTVTGPPRHGACAPASQKVLQRRRAWSLPGESGNILSENLPACFQHHRPQSKKSSRSPGLAQPGQAVPVTPKSTPVVLSSRPKCLSKPALQYASKVKPKHSRYVLGDRSWSRPRNRLSGGLRASTHARYSQQYSVRVEEDMSRLLLSGVAGPPHTARRST